MRTHIILPLCRRHTKHLLNLAATFSTRIYRPVTHLCIQNNGLPVDSPLNFVSKFTRTRTISNFRRKPLPVTIEDIFSETNRENTMKNVDTVKILRNIPPTKDEIPAAVLIPLCIVDGAPSILFTLRSVHIPLNRGDVSFPGGKQDDSDRNLIHTALRETEEELGLQRHRVEIWGAMNPMPNQLSVMITPVIGYCGELDLESLKPNPSEVEEAFTIQIEKLCDKQYFRTTQFSSLGGYTLPVFLAGKHRIWGMTAIFLHQFLTIFAPGLYNLKIRHRS